MADDHSSPLVPVRASGAPQEPYKPAAKRLREHCQMNVFTVTEPYPEVVKRIVRQLLSALENAERRIVRENPLLTAAVVPSPPAQASPLCKDDEHLFGPCQTCGMPYQASRVEPPTTDDIAWAQGELASPPAQEPTVGTRWKDKAMQRFVVVVGVSDAKVSYRNEASGRLTVTRTATFARMFEPAVSSPSVADDRPTWQPIETAPKDGTSVLLWELRVPLGLEGDAIIGSYVDFESVGGAPEGRHSGWFDDVTGEYEITPTHWMPLPSAPSASAGGEHDTKT